MAFSIEAASLLFEGTDTVTYTLTQHYDEVPIVTVAAENDINVFVDTVTTSQVIVKLSHPPVSKIYVDIHVISIGAGLSIWDMIIILK